MQGSAVERSAGEPPVIEPLGDKHPDLMGLALDIGLAGLALRIERVEGEVEIMLGRLPRLDGAAQWFRAASRLFATRASGRSRADTSGRLPLWERGLGRPLSFTASMLEACREFLSRHALDAV